VLSRLESRLLGHCSRKISRLETGDCAQFNTRQHGCRSTSSSSYSMLLQRFPSAAGLTNPAIDWVTPSLTDKMQQIVHSGQLSVAQPVLFGVPQDPY